MTEQDSGNRFEGSRDEGNLNPGPPIPRNDPPTWDDGWSTPTRVWSPPPGQDAVFGEADPHHYESMPGVETALHEKEKRGWFTPRMIFRDLLIPLALAAALALIAQATLFKPYQIPSPSMFPTIQVSDRILADRIIYRFHGIQRGDVVVFQPPNSVDPDIPYVKRVIGLPGDLVEIHRGKVMVNGEEVVIPTASSPIYPRQAEVVPAGMLFVLGDNRNESSDSHIWGYVPEDNVIGRADLIYWPLDHIQLLGM